MATFLFNPGYGSRCNTVLYNTTLDIVYNGRDRTSAVISQKQSHTSAWSPSYGRTVVSILRNWRTVNQQGSSMKTTTQGVIASQIIGNSYMFHCLFRLTTKATSKLWITAPFLWGDSTGYRWNPRTKGQWFCKTFPCDDVLFLTAISFSW